MNKSSTDFWQLKVGDFSHGIIIFDGVPYKTWFVTDGKNEYVIGETSLEKALVGEDGECVSETARMIDETIYAYANAEDTMSDLKASLDCFVNTSTMD